MFIELIKPQRYSQVPLNNEAMFSYYEHHYKFVSYKSIGEDSASNSSAYCQPEPNYHLLHCNVDAFACF